MFGVLVMSAHGIKPRQASVSDTLAKSLALRIELQRVMNEIRHEANAAKRQWETDVTDSLTAEGIPDDIARYAAKHSWSPGTAFDKAIKVQKILKELSKY